MRITPRLTSKAARLSIMFAISMIMTCMITSATNVPKSVLDTLHARLASADNANDSLEISLHIFDLANREEAMRHCWDIYDLSLRAKDEETTHFILRQMSCFYLKQDSVIDNILKLVEKLPESNEKDVTRLFVSIQKTTGEVTYSLNTEQRVAELKRRLVERDKRRHGKRKKELSKFEEIQKLWELCLYLGNTTKGEEYISNLNKLKKLIYSVDDEHNALKNAFYTTSAIAYTEAGYPELAIAADRNLLRIIDGLDAEYKKKGRIYRSYNRYYYICYRRMMSNYEKLPLADLDIYHRKVGELAAVDDEIAQDIEQSGRTTIYWLMAHKRYAEAIPLLKKAIANENSKRVRLDLYENLKKAATETGDRESLLYALEPLNELLEDYIQSNATTAYQEYLIRYDVDDMKAQHARMELEKKDSKLSYGKRLTMIVLIAAFLFMLLMMIILRFYLRERATVRHLAERNNQLEMELHDHLHEHHDDEAWENHRLNSKKNQKGCR